MREDVLTSDLLIDPELDKTCIYLLCHTRKYDCHSPLAGSLTEIPKGDDSSRVNERPLSLADDANLGVATLTALTLLKAACKSEEERTIDLIYLNSIRNGKTVCILH